MVDLARWLGQQLDTNAAEIANPYAEKAWHARGCESVPDVLYPDRETGACDCGVPARVLREIDAKRKLLAAYLPRGANPHPGEPCINYEGQDPANYDEHDSCWRHLKAGERLLHHDVGGAFALRLMASVYDDRPGYREEWRP